MKKKKSVLAKKPGSKNTRKTQQVAKKRTKFSPEYIEARLFVLEIDIDLIRKAPPLTPLLEEAEGGLPAVLAAMRFSADPTIVRFLQVYDGACENDRTCIPWEAWAIKAELNIQELLGSILIAMRLQSVNVIKVLAITGHPDTVRARIAAAKTPKGVRDRDSLDVSLGFLPSPKGPTFIGKYFAGTQGPEPEEPKGTPPPARPDETDVDDLFPDLGETQGLLTEGN